MRLSAQRGSSLAWLCVLPVAFGCAPSYEHVDARDPATEAGEPAVGVCYDDAHTLVVGPGPGCAEIALTPTPALEVDVCGARGLPVRVVRRGELPVQLAVEHIGVYTVEPLRRGVYRPSPTEDGECCGGLFEEDVLEGAVDVTPLTFGPGERAVELLASPGSTVLHLEACAIAMTERRRAYRAACREACETDVVCGFAADRVSCETRCELTMVQQPELCLDALVEAMRCEMALRCQAALTDDDVDPTRCPRDFRRTALECYFTPD